MTRYTNVGWKRTYFQANSDPKDDQIASNTASTSAQGSPHDAAASSHAPYGSSDDTPAEPIRKRRRKSKSNAEPIAATESTPAAIASDGDMTSLSVRKSERTKVQAAKLKRNAKERARRAKSACFDYAYTSAMTMSISCHCSCRRQSRVDGSAPVETQSRTKCAYDLLCLSRGWALGQGLSIFTARCRS